VHADSAFNPVCKASVALEPAAKETLSSQDEARAFRRLRYRLVRTVMRQAFSRGRLRLLLVLSLSLSLWLALFGLFFEGFLFLKNGIPHPVTHDQTVCAVFGTFFAALMVMLLFSSGVILYGSLFRSPDIALLLTMPVRAERVFLQKFQEAIFLSSWGFLLLGSPMLIAYGVVAHAPWFYYAILLPLMIAFIYIPSALGAVVCLGIMARLPNRRGNVLIVSGLILVVATLWIAWLILGGMESDMLTPDWFQEMLGRLSYSEQRLLPSWWLSSGLLEASRGVWSEGVLFLTLMIANALFCRQATLLVASRVYRAAYSKLSNRPSGRKIDRPAWIDRALLFGVPFVPRQMRLLMVKDMRLFRRDPTQWSQFLIFFGLLCLYFLNIRGLKYHDQHTAWVNMVSFLNVSVVGLLLSTFTTRFIFPMISLEGRRFWILGLLPLRRRTIVWEKFCFALGGSLIPCSALILLSDLMLRVAPIVLASHQLTCVVLCIGLSGIAAGLGARLPSLREESPSRIAAGFGGTLNLMVSTLYIVAVVMLTAVPCHFYVAFQQSRPTLAAAQVANMQWWLHFWLVGGTLGSIVLGILATAIPLMVGILAFRRLEF